MALVSPGVEVTIIDEAQYTSAAQNTVPYILIATAQDKVDPSGTNIAPGTTKESADNLYLITSQRELVNTFGNPKFYKTAGGNPIHGHELNEYGLMTAYSVLGVTNRVYIQRVDIDLAELEASLVRPEGKPNNGTYWFDLAESRYGLLVWNSASNSFNAIEPILITDTADLDSGVPAASIGTIGSYAIVTTNTNNPTYYKNKNNAWVLIGSDEWKASIPTIVGNNANPTLTVGDDMVINGTTIAATGTTVDTLVVDINTANIPGVTAGKENDRLALYIESPDPGQSPDSSIDVTLTIAAGGTGDLLGALGIAAGSYAGPIVEHASHINIPRWRTTDTTPRPSGSIWVKTSSVTDGMKIIIKRYNSTSNEFDIQGAPVYENDWAANADLDPAAGGKNITQGATYVQVDVNENDTGTFKIFERLAGETVVIGATVNPTFTVGDEFTVSASAANSSSLLAPVTVTMTGTTAADFVADVNGAGIPNVEAEVTSNGRVQIKHTGGGVMVVEDVTGGPLLAAGITAALENVRTRNNGQLIISNWLPLTYVASNVEPGQDPIDGTRWYYPAFDEVDIMIHEGGIWKGYRNVTNDIRGHDLTLTDPNGPIFSTIAPEFQSDGSSLEYGDLWIDTSDLENYPLLYRWENVNGVDSWVKIDLSDQVSTNGILFADARWANNDSTDPISDDIPLISDLLGSDYVDIDAPNPALYPDGMLLWNTRRSGFNVKEFRVNYFNANDFTSAILPTETNAWVTVSGLKDDGSANFGRLAQRAMIVSAMKEAIDTNPDIREEQRQFNLYAAPGYPELIPNMVALNNERANTGFVVGDTPLRLPNTGSEIQKWATNNNGLGLPTNDGLAVNDEYLGVFYPSGRTTDLDGTTIVVPPSYMMIRTIIHSDEQSYPWLAPAGTRRGQIDNVDGIGYLDAITNEFKPMLTRQGIRDVLYSNNVNPITFMSGAGYINFGNKTTKPGSALDRINVSRLVSYIRQQADAIGKLFVFEPNDKLTRDEIKGQMERMLNDLIAKRGLYDYVVVCDESNNTPARIDRNEIWVDIAIEPVKAGEFIYIPVRLKNTGEISGQ